jgi:hypothetical protein
MFLLTLCCYSGAAARLFPRESSVAADQAYRDDGPSTEAALPFADAIEGDN